MKYYAGIINNYNSFFFNMHPLSSGSAETLIERKFKGYYIYIVKSLPIYYKFLFKYGAGLIIYITWRRLMALNGLFPIFVDQIFVIGDGFGSDRAGNTDAQLLFVPPELFLSISSIAVLVFVVCLDVFFR